MVSCPLRSPAAAWSRIVRSARQSSVYSLFNVWEVAFIVVLLFVLFGDRDYTILYPDVLSKSYKKYIQ